jgi:hypothetical protein
MKIRCGIVLLIVGLGAGCVEMPLFPTEPKPPPPVPVRKSSPPAPAAVMPEEVTEANAREKADALEREIDAQSEVSTPSKPATAANKP